jgi:hypothetical protein
MSDDEFMASEWERFQHARIDTLQKRQTGRERADEEICGAHGLTVNRYWEILLKDDQKASDLEQILIEEFLSPRGFVTPDRRPHSIFKLCVRGALDDALESGKAWIRRTNVAPEVVSNTRKQTNIERMFPDLDLTRIKIGDAIEGEKRDPNDLVIVSMRDAIRWLIGNPECSHLVSANLRAIIQGAAEPESPAHPNNAAVVDDTEQAPAPHEAEQVESQKPHAGGRPRYLSKEVIAEEVFRLMNYHDEFVASDPEWDCQARLEDAIGNFYQSKIGKRPTKSTIQGNIREPLACWRKVKVGN